METPDHPEYLPPEPDTPEADSQETETIVMREFTRNRVNLTVQIHTADDAPIPLSTVGTTRALSMNGLFVETDTPFPEGTCCDVALTLPDGATTLHVAAQVATVERLGMGLSFEQMDPDSYQHLRRLALYYAQDVEVVEAELRNHLGFKTRLRELG